MEMLNIQSQGDIHQPSRTESSPLQLEPVSMEQLRAAEKPERKYPSASSAFAAPAHPDEDWTKISDLAERRRIQNRIAQRNYRKKIKERMADLERRGGSDGNKSSGTSSKNSPKSSRKPPSQSIMPQHPFAPPMNPEDHFLPSPSPSASSPPPFASYQPTYSPPSDNGMNMQPYSSPKLEQQTITTTGPYQFGMVSTNAPTLPPMTYFAGAYKAPNLNGGNESRSSFSKYDNHTYQTKTDERVYVCTLCDKAFAREHDRERHKSTHKKFVCKGELKDGNPWGCGRRFAVASNLGRHFRTVAGRICIKPLLDEEDFEKRRGHQSPSTQPARVGFRLPAAVLAQYPALASARQTAEDIEAGDSDYRWQFDSSGTDNDDTGSVSGTETDVVTKDDRLNLSSSLDIGDDTDENQALRPGSQARVDQTIQSTGIQFGSSTQNLGNQLLGETNLHPASNEESSRSHLRLARGDNVDNAEEPVQEATDRHDSDDNMSLRSFTESVFDMASIVSSASSSHSNSHTMATSFVEMLLRDPSMDSLLAISTSEFGVSSGRFTRNFSRILKSYSRHLQQAVEDSSGDIPHKYLVAAKSVSSARHQVSSLIASRYNERAPDGQNLKHREVDLISRHLDQPLPEENYDPSSNEESSEAELDLRIGDLEHLFFSGEPFRLLKRNLRSLVIPDEFLDCIYDSTRQFLDLILTDRRPRAFARGLLQAIANGDDIKSDLSIQVRLMAADLKAECTNVSQLDASIFLETYSQYISVVAIDQVKDVFATPGQSSQGFSIQGQQSNESESNDAVPNLNIMGPAEGSPRAALAHEDVLEQIVVEALPSVIYVDLFPHREFLASSSAFPSFLDALRGMVYPTFFSEATRSVKATIRSAETSDDKLSASEGQCVLAILSEMQSCLQSNSPINFPVKPSDTRVTALDSIKLAIEATTAAQWDWWPLQPPCRPERHDRTEMSWQCACGTERHESILSHYGSELRRIFNNFPLSPGVNSESLGRPASSLSNASSQGTRSTQSASSSTTNSILGQSGRSASSTANSAITAPDSVVDLSTGPPRYIYVFLLIRTSEYSFHTIDVSSMKARDFFQALKAAYKKHRGLWRRVFSVFVYNHCDFIKIIKPEPDTFMPGELKFELPSDYDDQYHYRPRPIYAPPITKHMFRHYFYGCYDSGTLSHRLHAYLPLTPTCRIRNPAEELLEFFPKRDRPVAAAAQSDKVEVIYGLAAREYRSFFRVVVYLCLAVAPAFWFVFAWLFRWGDTGDLQDATVPMTLTLAVLSILWAVVYSGSDVRKDYGDGT